MVVGVPEEEDEDRRGCELEGVPYRDAIAGRWGVGGTREGACEKSPAQLESGLFFSSAHAQRASSSVSRDVCQGSRPR